MDMKAANGLSKAAVKHISADMERGHLCLFNFQQFFGNEYEITDETPEAVLVLKTRPEFVIAAYETYREALDDMASLGYKVNVHVYDLPNRIQ